MCKEEQRSELMANGTRGQATFIFCFFLGIKACLHADRIIQEREGWYKRVETLLVLCSSVSYIGWDPVARIIPAFLYNCPQVHIWLQVIELRE